VGLDLAPGWRTLAASVAGVSHAAAAEPCADACAVRAEGERLVAVVADGAGASERAAEGARLACAAVLELATAWKGDADLGAFRRDEALAWLQAVRERLQAAAAAEQVDWRAFSCTLLVALVDARRAVFLQIGDGAIVYRGADGRYVPALWPQTGEYANTTWFVTDETAC
jgi:serine/threonine protein phosphatase PrpC